MDTRHAPRIRSLRSLYATAVLVGTACAPSGSTQHHPRPTQPRIVFAYEFPGSPDSALQSARFALGAIDGLIQIPRIQPKFTTVSTHYTRERRGGGNRQVAIMIAVDRHATTRDSTRVTGMELRAFALDMAQQVPVGQRRSGFPQTALSTNAPALRTPRPITPADTVDWQSMLFVAEALEIKGARRLP